MSADLSGAYHSTYRHRTTTAYQEPIKYRSGYTEANLTTIQYAAVVLSTATACATVTVPLLKLDRFYFLSDVPGESHRIFMSDKRAQFFRVLLDTHWWRGRRVSAIAVEYSFLLATFLLFRSFLLAQAPSLSNGSRGVVAGGLTGAIYAVARHPYDVLRATADAPSAPRRFTGAADVFWTALTRRPQVLRGLASGLGAAVVGRALQFSVQFGLYNWLRYDGVYRSPLVLFLYCHAASFLGLVALYPLQAMRQQLYRLNQQTYGRRLTYRALLLQLRQRHGMSKIYDGFFSSKPVLSAVPLALLMTTYDIASRRYTEYLHPETTVSASPQQSLLVVAPPSYVSAKSPYEFRSGAQHH